jgi:hypothetical protein
MQDDLLQKPPVDPERIASAEETLTALLAGSRRDTVPIRRAFVQREGQPNVKAGPLSELVVNRDHRGLLVYLLLLSLASKAPWDVRRPNSVWARALGLDPTVQASSVAISRAFRRLRDLNLITTERSLRQARVTVLREDGSGRRYTHPGSSTKREPYFKLPFAFWIDGWHQELGLPAVAMLLILRSLPADPRLALDFVPAWYGISRSTAARGLLELRDHGLVVSHWVQQPDPRTAEGYRFDLHHDLKGAFAVPRKKPSRTKPSAASRRRSRRAKGTGARRR